MMDAATIIRRVRALAGITRKELAQLAEVSPSTISRIERAELDPTWGMLSRILEATGYRISGNSLVSAGDPSAIAAARSVLQSVLVGPYADALSSLGIGSASLGEPIGREARSLGLAFDEEMASAVEAAPGSTAEDATEIGRWITRWVRAGWLSDPASADHMVTLAVSAGNAGKITRRDVARRTVVAIDGWRPLAKGLGKAGITYAVSGLLAARDDRATATLTSPVIYVEDPAQAVEALDLRETNPGEGVLLIASTGSELEGAETDNGIQFVSRVQGVLDAFAGSGREPDKAEDMLRHLLAAMRS
ncbi:helix-turn-helix domain-containing protein [Schaalia sp. JY-X159]|uniref:helix-turn-helix domain-containing protein n=1 Tax=Schaalia sp. JY-X159 TaxID=2758575 RepID=UPI00165D56F9|nr:helix-turn-helix transcriptional regulator [Schaalia sp. JY-X159]